MRTNWWASGVLLLCSSALAQTIRPPPQAEWDKATADVTGADAAARHAAVEKIKGWVKGGWVSSDLWRKWMPALVKADQHQAVADLALLGLLGRPNPDAVTILIEFRFKALVALNKKDGTDEILAAAKSYYNVCDFKLTATAVTYVGQALAKARPDDLEIVRKFRAEQSAASAAGGAAGDATTAPAGILSTAKIDDSIYKETLEKWSPKLKFADRVGYGNLLLLADKGAEAEKVYRELYALASTQEELATATEGIARSLRAEDGNVRGRMRC